MYLSSLPPMPGIRTGLSGATELIHEPFSTFSCSATLEDTPQPCFTSSVMQLPPNGMTAAYLTTFSCMMIRSVVPAPISRSATPISFSSSPSTAIADANGLRDVPFMFNAALESTFFLNCADVFLHVNTLKLENICLPIIPTGSLFPIKSSML